VKIAVYKLTTLQFMKEVWR